MVIRKGEVRIVFLLGPPTWGSPRSGWVLRPCRAPAHLAPQSLGSEKCFLLFSGFGQDRGPCFCPRGIKLWLQCYLLPGHSLISGEWCQLNSAQIAKFERVISLLKDLPVRKTNWRILRLPLTASPSYRSWKRKAISNTFLSLFTLIYCTISSRITLILKQTDALILPFIPLFSNVWINNVRYTLRLQSPVSNLSSMGSIHLNYKIDHVIFLFSVL